MLLQLVCNIFVGPISNESFSNIFVVEGQFFYMTYLIHIIMTRTHGTIISKPHKEIISKPHKELYVDI